MITLKNCRKMRLGFKFLVVLVGVPLTFLGVFWGQQGILDFERFKQEIEPLLTTTTYNDPAPGTTCISCHGDNTNAAFTDYPLIDGQSRQNFIETAKKIDLDNPANSQLLLKPLAIAALGVNHGLGANDGGEQFINTNNTTYQALVAWIEDATRSSIGAGVSKSVPHPNPFRFETTIVYFLTTAALDVEVIIFAMDGREVQRYQGGTLVGANKVTWDGLDKNFEPLHTGVYFYTVKARFNQGTVLHNGRVVYTP